MFEEKWWKPKSFEQLEKDEKERQFKAWVNKKCSNIISYASKNRSRFNGISREHDGVMRIFGRTIEAYESFYFEVCYDVVISDFWDKDNPEDMTIMEAKPY